MRSKLEYVPSQEVCATLISVEIEDGVIVRAEITDGCMGSSAGVCRLAVGMKASDVVARLEGTKCGFKNTSCPDQFAKAVREAVELLREAQ